MSLYDPSLQWAVLRLLVQWERLPLSDLLRLLGPLQRPRFRSDLLKDMEWEGLVEIRSVGDEEVITLTPSGRARHGGQRPTATPPSGEEP